MPFTCQTLEEKKRLIQDMKDHISELELTHCKNVEKIHAEREKETAALNAQLQESKVGREISIQQVLFNGSLGAR